jgi:predicted nucleic acid-binding protein
MIAIDANIVIYALTGNTEFAEPSKIILQRIAREGGIASVLLLSEVLSQTDSNQPAARREVQEFLGNLRGLRRIAVSEPIAFQTAALMRDYPKKLRLGDAVHLATALEMGAKEFWTNDLALAKITTSNLKIKTL